MIGSTSVLFTFGCRARWPDSSGPRRSAGSVSLRKRRRRGVPDVTKGVVHHRRPSGRRRRSHQQARLAPARGRRDLGESRPAAQHLRALHGLGPSLRFVGAVDRGGGTQHPFFEVLGPVCQPCRLVDGVADNRVLITVFGTDIACEDGPGRYSDAEVNGQAPQVGGQRPRGAGGTGRGPVRRGGRAR